MKAFRPLPLLLALTLTLLLASCRPPDSKDASTTSGAAGSDLRVRIETEQKPAVGPTPVRVYLLDGSQGVSGAQVEVTGTMTHAGMSPVIVQATETEPGIYRAADFEFTMAGDWILIADITLPDGSSEQTETTLSVPGG
ncbi:MAG TPA: FixH family protein [Trueperaceae bacterium]